MSGNRIAVAGYSPEIAQAAAAKAQKEYADQGINVVITAEGKCTGPAGRGFYEAVFFLDRGTGSECGDILKSWIGNPHLRMIDFTDISAGQDILKEEIDFFLGIPEPLEIERKYLIEYPDLKMFEEDPFCRRVEISQTYLEDEDGRFRVRKRGESGYYLYYLTRKKKISDIKRIETEEKITEEEYLKYLAGAPSPSLTLSKDRYCLLYNGRYFEVDVFPFWKDRALMEIELKSESEEAELPPQFKVIREVSTEKQYTNASIAQMLTGQRPMI